MTPRAGIAVGIVLVVAGFVVGLAFLFAAAGFRNLLAVAVAWALSISGLAVLLFRQSDAPIATGIALVLVAPLVWFLSILFPIRVAFFLLFLPAVAIALYGVFLVIFGLAEKRREEAG